MHQYRDKESIHVNSCGEVDAGGLYIGGVNTFDLEQKLGRKLVKKDVEDAIDEKVKNQVSAKEFELYQRITHLQGKFQTSQWRFYGRVRNDKPSISLCIEFIYFLSEEGIREKINGFARDYKGKVLTMYTGKHLDKWWNAGDPEPHTDANAHYGPDHGRPEKQVEVVFEVWKKSDDDIKDKIGRMSLQVKTLFKKAGVNII